MAEKRKLLLDILAENKLIEKETQEAVERVLGLIQGETRNHIEESVMILKNLKEEEEQIKIQEIIKKEKVKLNTIIEHYTALIDMMIEESFLCKKSLTDEESLRTNLHFWLQHIGQTEGREAVCYDEPMKTKYPIRKRGKRKLTLGDIPSKRLQKKVFKNIKIPVRLVLNFFVKNKRELAKQFKERTDILDILKKGENILVITNHTTWGNFPILIAAIERAYRNQKDLGKRRKFLERFYTLLGPAITTSKNGISMINSISNLIKTVPDTDGGRVLGAEDLTMKIKGSAIRNLIGLPKEGNIVVLCPSGTRDKIQEDGSIKIVNPTANSLTLIKSLNKKGFNVLVVGTNDLEIYNDRKISKGREYMEIGKLYKPGEVQDPNKIMQELASCIIDKNRQSIGKYEPEKKQD